MTKFKVNDRVFVTEFMEDNGLNLAEEGCTYRVVEVFDNCVKLRGFPEDFYAPSEILKKVEFAVGDEVKITKSVCASDFFWVPAMDKFLGTNGMVTSIEIDEYSFGWACSYKVVSEYYDDNGIPHTESWWYLEGSLEKILREPSKDVVVNDVPEPVEESIYVLDTSTITMPSSGTGVSPFGIVSSTDSDKKHNHYFKKCGYEYVDVYRVIRMFEITDPCIQHAVKKLLVTGGRGFKDTGHDIQDVIDTLERWKEMYDEETMDQ